MPMTPHPTSFGVFKPVDHVLMSFATAAQAAGADSALREAGLGAGNLFGYTPEQMRGQAEHDMLNAGALASLGQELNLVKAHHALALQGQHFLVAHAPNDAQVERITAVAVCFHATRAQRYGSLMIEELVPVGVTEQQVAESPDRGLDAQTPSGVEGAGPEESTTV